MYIFVGETEGFCYFQVENVRDSVSNVRVYKRLETTTIWTVTEFSVLSANFP